MSGLSPTGWVCVRDLRTWPHGRRRSGRGRRARSPVTVAIDLRATDGFRNGLVRFGGAVHLSRGVSGIGAESWNHSYALSSRTAVGLEMTEDAASESAFRRPDRGRFYMGAGEGSGRHPGG